MCLEGGTSVTGRQGGREGGRKGGRGGRKQEAGYDGRFENTDSRGVGFHPCDGNIPRALLCLFPSLSASLS